MSYPAGLQPSATSLRGVILLACLVPYILVELVLPPGVQTLPLLLGWLTEGYVINMAVLSCPQDKRTRLLGY